MNHIVDTCPLTKFEGGLNLQHEVVDDVAGICSDCSTRKILIFVASVFLLSLVCRREEHPARKN